MPTNHDYSHVPGRLGRGAVALCLSLLFGSCASADGVIGLPECDTPPSTLPDEPEPRDSSDAVDSARTPRPTLPTGERCPAPER